MSYSLTSAAVLSFELAHLPAGPTVADTLLTGLTASTATLARLARQARQARQAHDLPDVLSAPAADWTPRQLRSLSTAITDATGTAEMLALLRGARLDGPRALDRLIRTEILGPECAAAASLDGTARVAVADLLSAAALAAWAIDDNTMDSHPRRDHHVGTESTRDHYQLGPHHAAICDLVHSVSVPSTRAEWAAARPVDPSTWTAAMHQACWAAHLSGRVRIAAQAQLLGVLAFRAAGFGRAHVVNGMWNALSGILQATVVADLLDSTLREALLAPIRN